MWSQVRQILFALALLLVLGVEHAIALPAMFSVLVLLYVQNFTGRIQVFLLILAGTAYAIFYQFNLSLGILLFLFSQLFLLSSYKLSRSLGLRIVLSVLFMLLFSSFFIDNIFAWWHLLIYYILVFGLILIFLFWQRRRAKNLRVARNLK